MKQKVYLDYAAATPMDKRVMAVMQPYAQDIFYNPSALYLESQKVAGTLVSVRSRVAAVLGAKPGEIIFTAGGTEANNLAIYGLLSQYPDGNIVASSIEHDSVLMPARQFNVREVKVSPKGRISLEDLEEQIDDKTVLVSVMYANNEIGTIQPIRQVAKLVQQIRKNRQRDNNPLPLYLHTDACQAANYLDLYVHRLGVDLMTLNGGKIYGPKQSGVLFKASHVQLKPLILGGGQEHGMRSGTENVAGMVGFVEALEITQERREEEVERLHDLQQTFMDKLEETISFAVITGSRENRLPNNVHVQLAGQDNERLLMALDEEGVMCATGSACSASKEEASHVLAALGLTEEQARSSLRFTLGRETTLADIEFTVKKLAEIIEQ